MKMKIAHIIEIRIKKKFMLNHRFSEEFKKWIGSGWANINGCENLLISAHGNLYE